MSVTKVTERLSVSPQPATSDFKALAQQGFTAVINNRPDGEEPSQPGSAAEEKAAREAGLNYHDIPVTGTGLTANDVRAFQAALAANPGPVLAHCKTGTRSLMLYAIGEVLDECMLASSVRAFGEAHGFDLRGAETWLAGHGGERS